MLKRGALHFTDQKLTQGVEVMFPTKWLAPGNIVYKRIRNVQYPTKGI